MCAYWREVRGKLKKNKERIYFNIEITQLLTCGVKCLHTCTHTYAWMHALRQCTVYIYCHDFPVLLTIVWCEDVHTIQRSLRAYINAARCSLVWTCGLHLALVVGPRHRFFTVRSLPERVGKLCLQVSFALCLGPVGCCGCGRQWERRPPLCLAPHFPFPTSVMAAGSSRAPRARAWESAARRSPAYFRLWVRSKPLLCWATLTCYCCVT